MSNEADYYTLGYTPGPCRLQRQANAAAPASDRGDKMMTLSDYAFVAYSLFCEFIGGIIGYHIAKDKYSKGKREHKMNNEELILWQERNIAGLRAENKKYLDALTWILDEARTGLPITGMTEDQWNQHRLFMIESQAAGAIRCGAAEKTGDQLYAHQLTQLFLTSPETDNQCVFCSPPRNNGFGSYSFDVRDVITGEVWTHTVLTCEKDVADGITMRIGRNKKA